MNEDEWHQILDTHAESISRDARTRYTLERIREEEQAQKLIERKKNDRIERHRYIQRTFNISSLEHIVTALDIVLPAYLQRSSQYTKPVLRFLFNALLEKFPENITTVNDTHFWSSLLDKNMSIKEMLQFQAIPTITKSSNERISSAEAIKMAVIREYMAPKIRIIEELIRSNNIPGILPIYGWNANATNAPAA